MQRPNTTDKAMAIRIIEHGIHELTWLSADLNAVDAWFEYNDALYQTTSPDEMLRFLHIAILPKFPSISQISRRARTLQSMYPVQPKTRTAILSKLSFWSGFINMLSGLLNRNGQDVTRFFSEDERETAIEWLLEG